MDWGPATWHGKRKTEKKPERISREPKDLCDWDAFQIINWRDFSSIGRFRPVDEKSR
jgi:hypothetical protein